MYSALQLQLPQTALCWYSSNVKLEQADTCSMYAHNCGIQIKVNISYSSVVAYMILEPRSAQA
jgi:uncharacterized protein YneR